MSTLSWSVCLVLLWSLPLPADCASTDAPNAPIGSSEVIPRAQFAALKVELSDLHDRIEVFKGEYRTATALKTAALLTALGSGVVGGVMIILADDTAGGMGNSGIVFGVGGTVTGILSILALAAEHRAGRALGGFREAEDAAKRDESESDEGNVKKPKERVEFRREVFRPIGR